MGESLPPPPPSALLPPVASKAKDYSMERPSEVQTELDDLRNRGLAKVLNRHFTDTTKKLAKEKAAADAALADLERRRANTSEFVPSKGGELNPFDSMYVQLQQKRAECRRKERETLLLYQRYVHKYGNKAKPEVLSPAASASSTPEVPPPPSPLPAKTPLQPLEEENSAPVDPGVNFAKFYNKQIQDAKNDPPTKNLDDSLNDVPDLQVLTPQPSRESGASDPPELNGELFSDEDSFIPKDPNTTRRSLKADPPAVKFAKEIETSDTPNMEVPEDGSANGLEMTETLFVKDEESATAEESCTRVESTVKPVITEPLVETGSNSSESESNRPTREVTTELGSTTPADEEEDDRSIISGLTMNSHVTKQLIEEIEQEVTRFLNTETEAIRKLLDEDEERTKESSSFNDSLVGHESRRASMKAEAMALEMQKILDEYIKEDSSESPLAAEESEVDADTVATSAYPRKYETSDPTKQWMVYYDESFQREYYYEKNTKTTQWEPPGRERGSLIAPLLSEQVAPTSLVRTTSRRDLYRRKIRRRRMRRLAATSFIIICAAGTGYHWQHNHPDKTFPEAMLATWHTTSETLADVYEASLYNLADTVELVRDQIEYQFTDRKLREEAAKLAEIEQARLEEEKLMAARAEAERRAKEEEAKRIKEQEEQLEAVVSQEVADFELENQGMAAEAQTEEAPPSTQEEIIEPTNSGAEETNSTLKRPWGCFLPLSYIHPKCNRLAKLKPLYKDTDVLNSFLQ